MQPRWWVMISAVVAVLTLFCLYYVVYYIWPAPETVLARPQILLFTFMFLGLGSLTVPISAYLNHRFARNGWSQRDKTRLVRQGAWVGLFGVLLAYLQLIRALNWTIAIVLAGVFVLIEVFFLTRE
jgi:hypothetical protein